MARSREKTEFNCESTISLVKQQFSNYVHFESDSGESLNDSLISVGQIRDAGKLVLFTKKGAVILHLSPLIR